MREKIFSIAQILHLPVVCVLCQQYHYKDAAVCELCKKLLKRIGPCCLYCALPLPDEDYLICGFCCKKKPLFDKTRTAYLFEEPLRSLLHQFKYEAALYLRSFLVSLLLDAVPASGLETQCLIPVPLHPKRVRQRGYNQALELTKLLAKKLDLPYEPNLCKKTINTPSQAGLGRQQRRQNLRLVFDVNSTSYQQITLVDDLLTTGSTANELARALKEKGVKQVDLLCCARVNREHTFANHSKLIAGK